MIFTVSGKFYRVRFYRINSSTYAELERFDEDVNDFVTTNLVGIAYLNPKDRFVKSMGRKIALTHLITRMAEVSASDSKPEFILAKEDRRNIWDAYFKAHPKDKK